MVKLFFKMREVGSVELKLDSPATLQDVLELGAKQAGIELGSYIAVQKGKVVPATEIIQGEEEIDIFPALSGG